ncbi:MAG TPA: hypothetical protein VFW44_02690 [Bryobacteraceae bacterium]|nr:hypothetical protein [Bryobacteraceae bacterium]
MLFARICILAATLAVNTVFIMTLLAGLSWGERALFLFATVVLAGGIIFTLRSFQDLSGTESAAPSRQD